MFASREDAGCRLAHRLLEQGVKTDFVLGLPRGGVVVAAEIARVLKAPLDVLVVRKIGHPFHREFAVGAMAEHDVVLLDEQAIGGSRAVRVELAEIVEEERVRLREYETRFHRAVAPVMANKAVLLVDDGLATGATMEAAARSARKQGAFRVTVTVPVASPSAVERLSRVAEDVISLVVDPNFDAVGRYYTAFTQTSDEEVLQLLQMRDTA